MPAAKRKPVKTKPKSTRRPAARSAPKPRAAPPMPDLKSEEAAARVTADAYAAGKYELQPEHTAPAPAPEPEPLEDAAPPVDAPDPETAASEAPVALGTPVHLIRMTHPDNGSADGLQTDESGAVLVPAWQVAELTAHGFVVDHLPQPDATDE